MKKYNLDKEEKEILKTYEAGDLKPVKNLSREKKRHGAYIKNTLQKSRAISIRLSERDLHRIKTLAAERGMPYQTLISSVLHQYSDKK